MIELMLGKLGFSGILAAILAIGVIGTGAYAKFRINRLTIKNQSLTAQVREVAAERDRLLNANRSLTLSIQRQNDAIDGYVRAGQIQQQRADRAQRELQSKKDEWDAYIRHLDQGTGADRWQTIRDTFGDMTVKWNKGDTLPSEVE